jgi:3-hydroxybutyryl-CoA dehydrogenase
MIVVVLADDILKQELLFKDVGPNVEVQWADSLRAFTAMEGDVYIDMLFELDNERTDRLKQLLPKPVLVNAVSFSTKTIGQPFIRINAWPSLFQRSLVEVALPASIQEENIQNIFKELDWQYRIVPDMPGMITARILAAIINEAYYTWGSGVSGKEEIDTAMKLGTNYPMGPFEWSKKIGLQRVYELLKELGRTDDRYAIAPALEKEVS